MNIELFLKTKRFWRQSLFLKATFGGRAISGGYNKPNNEIQYQVMNYLRLYCDNQSQKDLNKNCLWEEEGPQYSRELIEPNIKCNMLIRAAQNFLHISNLQHMLRFLRWQFISLVAILVFVLPFLQSRFLTISKDTDQ